MDPTKSQPKAAVRAPVILVLIGLILGCGSQFVSANEVSWSCYETIYHSIHESTDLTESRVQKNVQKLDWIDKNTIGFQSLTLRRSNQQTDAFIRNDGDFKALYINDREVPHLVILIEPQTWMNTFGNLRVRFYRCQP